MARIPEFISPDIVRNLGQELLNAVGTEVQTADTRLYERKTLDFRSIINNNFPTMLVVDYDNIKSELKMYQDIESSLKKYIDQNYKPTEKDYSVSKLSDHEISLIIKAIKLGIKQVKAIPKSYKELRAELEYIVESSQSTNTVLSKVNKLFSNTYKITDIVGNADVFIFSNYETGYDSLKRPLDIGLSTALVDTNIPGLDSIGQILAYGHSAAGYVDETGKAVLNFNSPKLLAIMFDVISSANDKSSKGPQDPLTAAAFFVEDTKQAEVFVTIDKDFSEGFLKLFVSVGGNIVRFENSLINSRRGSILEKKEKRGVNKAVLERLARALSNTQTTVGSRLSRYILNKKSSPSLLDYVQYSVISGLRGEKISSHKSSITETSKSKKEAVKKQVVSGIVKSKIKIPKRTYKPTVIPQKSIVSLDIMLNVINSGLQEQIRKNMGTGDRRDVLNYRSGRFAQSVKVERMSQSREGMITAFYSYMKNPYATFSQGGQQEFPRSRDPKTLISKSIREIAGSMMKNRMRAVNV